MPVQATSGAASYDAFGGGVPVVPNYIEEVFSTWLYTGTGNALTVTNGIDILGKGGLVWAKDRTFAGESNRLYDTTRGVNKVLITDLTNSSSTVGDLSSFNSNGFTVASAATSNINYAPDNPSPHNYVTWTFREQPKFFDVVTYTGDGNTPRNIAHNLGAIPGFIIIKRTDTTGSWFTYARNSSNTYDLLILNGTSASAGTASAASLATSTTFDPTAAGTGWAVSQTNIDTATYIVYLFAHNAGGFGLTGIDNVISCGSYSGTGTVNGLNITLGYEPQWVMIKRINQPGNGWYVIDNMRGFNVVTSNGDALLQPNTSAAETGTNSGGTYIIPTSTGFQVTSTSNDVNAGLSTYFYMAIRRGPMKTPTTSASVFSANAFNAAANTYQTTNFPIDWQITADRNGAADKRNYSRLPGVATPGTSAGRYLSTNTSDAEAATGSLTVGWDNTGFRVPSSYASVPFVAWNFGRAPSFFDQVCWTGTGTTTRTLNHNLAAAPELMIARARSADSWYAYLSSGNVRMLLNLANASPVYSGYFEGFTQTATTFSFDLNLNASGSTYMAWLFASCPGVSKVGSYTGTGLTQIIDCGFTGSARFVIIKRTNGSGNWWVWDSSRGMVSGSDPRLLLNDIGSEINSDWVLGFAGGFRIVTTDASVNASGGNYIYFAISS